MVLHAATSRVGDRLQMSKTNIFATMTNTGMDLVCDVLHAYSRLPVVSGTVVWQHVATSVFECFARIQRARCQQHHA